jgi:hypothetical protein
MHPFTRPSPPIQSASGAVAVSPRGGALGVEAEAFLASQAAPATGRPSAAQYVSVSVEAVEQLLAERSWFRDTAEQIGCVPAGSVVLVLEQTIALLRGKGWVRGAYEKDGGYCLTGALEAAAKALGVAWEVHRAAELTAQLTLAGYTPENTINLIRWNDDLRRTGEQVLGLLASAVVVAWRYGATA